jgi:hypothetical protein
MRLKVSDLDDGKMRNERGNRRFFCGTDIASKRECDASRRLGE